MIRKHADVYRSVLPGPQPWAVEIRIFYPGWTDCSTSWHKRHADALRYAVRAVGA